MERRSNIILCFLILFLCSCEKQRFLNVPITSTKYVVNGLFGSNEPCRLEISKSQSLNDTNAIENVGTANTFLYEGDRLIEKLKYAPPVPGKSIGTYKSDFKDFVKSRKYSINVEVDGSESISASDIIPNAEAEVSNFTGPLGTDSSQGNLNFGLVLKQDNTAMQYFHLLLQQRWVLYSINQGDSNLTYNDWFNGAVFPEQDPTGFIPTTSEPFSLIIGGISQGIMLDNQHFTGLTKSINFSAKNTNPLFTNTYLESRVIVRSVSANYFKYYFSSSQYYRTKGIPLTEPVIIHNNITNGLGNFSGYSSDTSAVIRTYY